AGLTADRRRGKSVRHDQSDVREEAKRFLSALDYRLGGGGLEGKDRRAAPGRVRIAQRLVRRQPGEANRAALEIPRSGVTKCLRFAPTSDCAGAKPKPQWLILLLFLLLLNRLLDR